jgi:hypothetical protein
MTVETLLLAVTTLIALVAVIVAVAAVRAVGRLRHTLDAVIQERKTLHSSETGGTDAEMIVAPAVPNAEIFAPELAPQVVQGRVVVPPTQAQVVRTALGRPGVRLSVFAHGLARALRAENRDRIVALMRREYRHRRNQRLRAGRQAIRMARPTPAPSTERLHEHLLEPKPLSLTDRMISS